ncbi:HEAT repeat domain-containing protein [Methanooceanicella nereidis]|nr:HEAT repeat domain-containing protein [Methanocella sp. CWC-04]
MPDECYVLEHKEISSLIRSLADHNMSERSAESLINMGRQAVQPLIVALKDPNMDVRGNAAWILGSIRDERAIEPLIGMLKDEELEARVVAGVALIKIGMPAVEPLIASLKRCDSKLKRTTANVLMGLCKEDRVDTGSKQKIMNTLRSI